jgi:hypothetical protein
LLDETSKKYKRSGVIDQHDMFASCTILNLTKSMYSQEKDKFMRTKEYYVTIGKGNDELRLPSNQYGLASSPDNEKKKTKIHILEILTPNIRLSKEEKVMVEKVKVLLHLGMPMTVRRNQTNPSGKKASVGAPQPSCATALQPTSSLAKKNTSSTDAIPITRFSKFGFLDSLKKTLTCFVMQERGSICVERLGYILKIVQLSIEGFKTMPEE